MKATVMIIKNKDKTLFLLRKTKPFGWCLPGGKLDEGETSKEAVIREVFEETKIELNENEIDFVKTKLSISGIEVDIYKVAVEDEPSVIINKTEHTNKKWMTEKEVKEIALAGNTSDFIN
jgi:ADP-ribose pyrophosphatase YjhB (NUDIX family)